LNLFRHVAMGTEKDHAVGGRHIVSIHQYPEVRVVGYQRPSFPG
jgi:hypothetical protein